MTEVKSGRVPLEGGEICSEDNCRRPAVRSFRTVYGDLTYNCERHEKLAYEYVSRDMINEALDQLEDWSAQIEVMSESVWTDNPELKDVLVLRNRVSDDIGVPYKDQHQFTLDHISWILDQARDDAQEKIDRTEACLREYEDDEPPCDCDDIGD